MTKRQAKQVTHYECDCGGHLEFIESTKIEQEMDMLYCGPAIYTDYWKCPKCDTIFAAHFVDYKLISFDEYSNHTAEEIKKLAPRGSGWLC